MHLHISAFNLALQVNGFHEEKPKEPIYETIPVGLSGAQARREPNYVSGPPPDGKPKDEDG